jgi:hypothetical protein
MVERNRAPIAIEAIDRSVADARQFDRPQLSLGWMTIVFFNRNRVKPSRSPHESQLSSLATRSRVGARSGSSMLSIHIYPFECSQ